MTPAEKEPRKISASSTSISSSSDCYCDTTAPCENGDVMKGTVSTVKDGLPESTAVSAVDDPEAAIALAESPPAVVTGGVERPDPSKPRDDPDCQDPGGAQARGRQGRFPKPCPLMDFRGFLRRSIGADKGEEEDVATDATESGRRLLRNHDSGASGATQVAEVADDDKIGRRAIFWLRIVLLLVLCALVAGVAATVYQLVANNETRAFEAAFRDDSAKILGGLAGSLDLTLSAVDNFVVSLSSYANASNETWPFVTLPHYAVQMAKLRSICKALYMAYAPLVTAANRAEWERYAKKEGEAWVLEGMDIQGRDPNYHGIFMDEYSLSSTIYDNDGDTPADANGPFFPTWQAYPVVPRWPPFNWDYSVYTAFNQSEVVDSKRVSITKVSNYPVDSDPISTAQAQLTSDWAEDYVGGHEDSSEPIVDVYMYVKGKSA